MTVFGYLRFNNKQFEIEEANIYGIFESNGYMTWHIEIFPPGEENYIMLNALILDKKIYPDQFDGFFYQKRSNKDDLFEHTVFVDGDDSFLNSINIVFSNWSNENQTLHLNGNGTIDTDNMQEEVTYSVDTILKFKGINLFNTTKEAANKFIDTYLQNKKDAIKIEFEEVKSGLKAIIRGKFQ